VACAMQNGMGRRARRFPEDRDCTAIRLCMQEGPHGGSSSQVRVGDVRREAVHGLRRRRQEPRA
jgi:hypothetical protein